MLDKRYHFDNVFNTPRTFGGVLLYQIGDLCCSAGACIPLHTQYCHEISYVVAGTGTFDLDGKAYRVKAGDLFLCPKGSAHRIRSSQYNPLWYYYCGFLLDTDGFGTDGDALERFFSTPPL